jgi:hypothetical protein
MLPFYSYSNTSIGPSNGASEIFKAAETAFIPNNTDHIRRKQVLNNYTYSSIAFGILAEWIYSIILDLKDSIIH